MGWGKKITTDIQVIAVCKETAVDWSVSPKADYKATRDLSLLKYRPGEQPTLFTLRPLPPGILARILSLSVSERRLMAFQFGVRSCSDTSLGLRWIGDSEAGRHVDGESLGAIPSDVWQEIGALVIEREELSEGERPRFGA